MPTLLKLPDVNVTLLEKVATPFTFRVLDMVTLLATLNVLLIIVLDTVYRVLFVNVFPFIVTSPENTENPRLLKYPKLLVSTTLFEKFTRPFTPSVPPSNAAPVAPVVNVLDPVTFIVLLKFVIPFTVRLLEKLPLPFTSNWYCPALQFTAIDDAKV
jgi:hypothetical protein